MFYDHLHQCIIQYYVVLLLCGDDELEINEDLLMWVGCWVIRGYKNLLLLLPYGAIGGLKVAWANTIRGYY